MVSDVAQRSLAQAYRWFIAGLTAAVVTLVGPLSTFEWPQTGLKFGSIGLILVAAFCGEYINQVEFDPEIERNSYPLIERLRRN
jgi:hypothetical protein